MGVACRHQTGSGCFYASNKSTIHHAKSQQTGTIPNPGLFRSQIARRCHANPAYGLYFIRHSENNDQYAAIAVLKEDQRTNSNKQTQRVWFMYGWSAEAETLAWLYASLEAVDWQNDDFVIFDSLNNQTSNAAMAALYRPRPAKLNPLHRFVMDRQSALHLELKFPDDIYVKSLEVCHVEIIYDTWAFKEMSCVQAIRNNIIDLPSAGVFTKDGDRLVSWIIGHNGMNRLYTLDEYRRRGYATYATLYLAKRMAQAGYPPLVHIAPHNHASIAFFQSKGFKFVFTVCMQLILS